MGNATQKLKLQIFLWQNRRQETDVCFLFYRKQYLLPRWWPPPSNVDGHREQVATSVKKILIVLPLFFFINHHFWFPVVEALVGVGRKPQSSVVSEFLVELLPNNSFRNEITWRARLYKDSLAFQYPLMAKNFDKGRRIQFLYCYSYVKTVSNSKPLMFRTTWEDICLPILVPRYVT